MIVFIRVLALSCIVLTATSCSALLFRVKFDGRSPDKNRTDRALLSYLDRNEYEFDHFFRINPDTLAELISRPHKPGWDPDFRIFTIKCFDANDSLIMNWSVCEGFIDELGLLNQFPPVFNGPFFPADLSTELSWCLNDGKIAERSDVGEAEMVMVVYWARWLGNLNTECAGKAVEYRKRYPDKSIRLVLVALDNDKRDRSINYKRNKK